MALIRALFLILVYEELTHGLKCDTSSTTEEADECYRSIVKYTTHYSELTQETDAIEGLAKLSSSASSIIKLSGAAGVLVSVGVDMAFAPLSDEERAIKLLSSSMDKQFLKISRTITEAVESISVKLDAIKYEAEATIPLNVLERSFKKVMNDDFDERSIHYDEFLDKCADIKFDDLIEFFQVNFQTNCHLRPTNPHAYANLTEVLGDLQNIVPDAKDDYEYELVTAKLRSIISSLSLNVSSSLIESLRQSRLTSRAEIISHIHELLNGKDVRDDQHGICMLSSVFDANRRRRGPLNGMGNILQADLARLVAMGTMCFQLRYANNKRFLATKLLFLESAIEGIANGAREWIHFSLDNSFPKDGISAAKEYIRANQGVKVEDYEKAAKHIQGLFRERGSLWYTYSVIIMGCADVVDFYGEQLSYNSMADMECTYGIRLVVVKSSIDPTKLIAAFRWLKETKDVILKKTGSDEIYWKETAQEQLKEIRKTIPLLDNRAYTSVVLLRNYRFIRSQARVQFAVVFANEEGEPAGEFIENFNEDHQPFYSYEHLVLLFVR